MPILKSQIQDGENEKTLGWALHRNAFECVHVTFITSVNLEQRQGDCSF